MSQIEQLRSLLNTRIKNGHSLVKLLPLSQQLDVEIYNEMLKINLGKLSIGIGKNFYPFSFIDKSGSLAGYGIDLCRALSELYNVKIEFHVFDCINDVINALQANVVDLAANISITPSRKEALIFSDSYLKNHLGVAVSKQYKHLQSWKELDQHGMIITIVQNSIADQMVHKLFKRATVQRVNNSTSAGQAVLERQAAAVISNQYWIKAFQSNNPGEISISTSELCRPYLTAMAAGKQKQPVIDKINLFFKDYRMMDLVEKNQKKWFVEEGGAF